MELMLSQDVTAKSVPGAAIAGTDTIDPFLPLELLELELSLEGFSGGEPGFCEAVRKAASAVQGDFLFDLPAEGLIPDCRRLAVLRIPEGNATMRTLFAALDEDGAEIRLLQPDEDTAHLLRFADAFVDLLQRMPTKPKEAA